MNIILLYGPGEVGKRNEGLKIRKSFDNRVKIIDLKHSNPADLGMELLSDTLFEVGPRLVVGENAPDSLDLEKLKGTNNITLLIITGNLKADSFLFKSAKKTGAKIVLFEGEKEVPVFPFLDALIEGKKKAFLELNKLLKEHGGIYIITMIYYMLRRNILPPPPSPFVQKKIQSQKQGYKDSDWVKLYRLALENEAVLKSGLGSEDIILTRMVQAIISKNL